MLLIFLSALAVVGAVIALGVCPKKKSQSEVPQRDVENPVVPQVPVPNKSNSSFNGNKPYNPAIQNLKNENGRATVNSVSSAQSVASAKFLDTPQENHFVNEARRNEDYDPTNRKVSDLIL